MEGMVTAYDGLHLTFTADLSHGSGTFAAWNINLTGAPGTTTVTGAGTLGLQNANAAAITGGTVSGTAITMPTPVNPGDAVPKSYIDGRNINTSGLASGGGNLSADRTISVPIAATSDATNGVSDTLAMTPLKTAQAISALGTGVPSSTVVFTLKNAAPPGWLMFNDGTMGDASSGASHANADAQTVFTDLYSYSDANCPLYTSAGTLVTRASQGTAAAAWAAHCRISLPKALGRAFAAAGTGAGLSVRTMGDNVGEQAHTQTIAELVAHGHQLPGGDIAPWMTAAQSGTFIWVVQSDGTAYGGYPTQNSGSGNPFNVMQPTVFLNAMVKL
jgi:hypothetical protein